MSIGTGEATTVRGGADEAASPDLRSAERMTFFTDAVVAIALTLLILPLLESVGESRAEGQTGHEWLVEHGALLPGFVLSFLIIATFWMGHHALHEHVRAFTSSLTWLNVLWLLTIVWLPVATAITGLRSDATSIVIYIGTLVVTSITTVAVNVVVHRHPETWAPANPPTGQGFWVACALAILYTVALVAALVIVNAVPSNRGGQAYFSLFTMALTTPVARGLRRFVHPPWTSSGPPLAGR